MADENGKKTLNADMGLELMMRDSLSGLEELASMASARPWLGELEIISIEPPAREPEPPLMWVGSRLTH